MNDDAAYWTKKTPTEPGYYWWREDIAHHARIAYFTEDRRMILMGWLDSQSPAAFLGEWYGPLQEPGGDAVENCQ